MAHVIEIDGVITVTQDDELAFALYYGAVALDRAAMMYSTSSLGSALQYAQAISA